MIVQRMTSILKSDLRYVTPYRLVNSYRSVEGSLFFHLTDQYDITSQKTWIAPNTALRISDLILLLFCSILLLHIS